jgi:glucosylceramidase
MIRQFLTSQSNGDRIAEHTVLTQQAARDSLASVWVDPKRTFQTLEGFGTAFTESAATTWLKLSPPQREQVMQDYFSVQNGNGYTFCRVHMNSCDFSLLVQHPFCNFPDLVLGYF